MASFFKISLVYISIIHFGCNSKHEHSKVVMDTIYSAQLKGSSFYKPISVTIAGTETTTPLKFRVGDTTAISIKTNRLSEYPSQIKNMDKVQIIESDSINGIFEIAPLDSNFRFELWKNFGEGKVVFKNRDSNTELLEGSYMISIHNIQADK